MTYASPCPPQGIAATKGLGAASRGALAGTGLPLAPPGKNRQPIHLRKASLTWASPRVQLPCCLTIAATTESPSPPPLPTEKQSHRVAGSPPEVAGPAGRHRVMPGSCFHVSCSKHQALLGNTPSASGLGGTCPASAWPSVRVKGPNPGPLEELARTAFPTHSETSETAQMSINTRMGKHGMALCPLEHD
uniref:cDNA FLJ59017 n=1 Tax=Homo sapiens TaxID=9606 RepID=B7Z1X7_HUMAN|nr:unnamed protein product [Homo sapiens]